MKIHGMSSCSLAKNLIAGLIIVGAIGLVGCNTGGSSGATTGGSNPYGITNYSLSTDGIQSNCSISTTESSTIDCTSNSLIGSFYKVSFVEPNDAPGAYVLLPNPNVTNYFDVTVATTGCDQTPAAGGATYTCHFNLTGNNVQSGNSFPIQINGSLGLYSIITVKLN